MTENDTGRRKVIATVALFAAVTLAAGGFGYNVGYQHARDDMRAEFEEAFSAFDDIPDDTADEAPVDTVEATPEDTAEIGPDDDVEVFTAEPGGPLSMHGMDITIGEAIYLDPGAPYEYEDFGTPRQATPGGRYVIVRLNWTNTAGIPLAPESAADAIRLVDAVGPTPDGREYDADYDISTGTTYQRGSLFPYDTINPGASGSTWHVFDVPVDAELVGVGFGRGWNFEDGIGFLPFPEAG